jgi:hypothetical protein
MVQTVYQVESGIPIPLQQRRSPGLKYPFRHMKVGDSFFVGKKASISISGHVSYAKRLLHQDYTMRTVAGGVRVWRTK